MRRRDHSRPSTRRARRLLCAQISKIGGKELDRGPRSPAGPHEWSLRRGKIPVIRNPPSVVPRGAARSVDLQIGNRAGRVGPPLDTIARDDAEFSVAIRRTPYCDSEASGIDSTDQMRCFQVVHGSWRLPKGAIEDQWWK